MLTNSLHKAPILQRHIGLPIDKIGIDLHDGNHDLMTTSTASESLFVLLSKFLRHTLLLPWPDHLLIELCSYISIPTLIQTYGDYMASEVHYINYLGEVNILFRHWDPRGPEDHHELHRMDWITTEPSLSTLFQLGVRCIRIQRIYHECWRGYQSRCSTKHTASRFEVGFIQHEAKSEVCKDFMKVANDGYCTSLLNAARSLKLQKKTSVVHVENGTRRILTNPTIYGFEFHDGIKAVNGITEYKIENFKKKSKTMAFFDEEDVLDCETLYLELTDDQRGNKYVQLYNELKESILDPFIITGNKNLENTFFFGATVCCCNNDFVENLGGTAFTFDFW